MGLKLTSRSIYGCTEYIDESDRISFLNIKDKWYPSLEGMIFDAGFCNITCASDFIQDMDNHKESLQLLGYYQVGDDFINDSNEGFISQVEIQDDGTFLIRSSKYENGEIYDREDRCEANFDKLELLLIDILEDFNIDVFVSAAIVSDELSEQFVIEAKSKGISSRDITKNLVRVKSSNLWSYGIDIKDRKDKTGNVYVQFKNKNGGPGDIYQYLDVPVNLWRKFLAAPSKGHFLWAYIRNQFSYRKLTGDKRGKLPNAIN